MKDISDTTPRLDVLKGVLRERGIGPCLWQKPGPRDTDIRTIECHVWPAAKTVVIVQMFGKRVGRGRPAGDIDGWEIFAPVSRHNDIETTRVDMLGYENCTPGEPSITPAYNGGTVD